MSDSLDVTMTKILDIVAGKDPAARRAFAASMMLTISRREPTPGTQEFEDWRSAIEAIEDARRNLMDA